VAGVETFVIRVWTPGEQEANPEDVVLRGLAEHVGSAERRAFHGASELLAFLEQRLEHEPARESRRRSDWR
jgi:hypothetical protein